jgi:hypothetical protein
MPHDPSHECTAIPGRQPHVRRQAPRGCLVQLGISLLFAVVVVPGVESLLGPWIYVVGGRTRLPPFWTGRGDVQTAAGTYRIYFWFSPSSGGSSRMYAST